MQGFCICLYPVTGLADKPEISEPFNFTHLTHTHAEHFQEIDKADHHNLANEFAVIRATQVPQRELQGIKAESLLSKNTQSEPTSPTRQTPYLPSFTSPVKSTYCDRLENPDAAQTAHHADYFSQPPFTSEPHRFTTMPRPPRRPAPRAAVSAAPDFFTDGHQAPLQQQFPFSTTNYPDPPTDTAVTPLSHQSLSPNNAFQDFDFSVVHAVTTPDDSAFPLSPSRIRVPGAELADVPEEDERTTATHSRTSTPISSLRHAKSFPSTRPSSQSRSPRKVHGRTLDTAEPHVENVAQSEASLPFVGESFEDIPEQPSLSKRLSYKFSAFDSCWEEDIDYCYEHAAEADCEFDWDRVSIKDGTAKNTVTLDDCLVESRAQSVSEGYEDVSYPTTSSESLSNESSRLPRLHTSLSVPPLSSANSAKSPSIGSLATPATPSYSLHSPQPYGLSNRTFLGSTDTLDISPPLPGYLGSSSAVLSEDIYDNLFHNKSSTEVDLPLHSLRLGPLASQDVSPRSSRSPISKCDSQESFMLSRSSSVRYPQSCDSFGSVPDLVHSNKTSRDRLDLTAEQMADLAATIKAAETPADVRVASQQRSNQNLAKDLARNSMLQKASSFTSADENDYENSEVVVLPSVSHHERSQSAAVPQPLSAIGQRKRSATSATTAPKTGRASYSLFPSTPVRSPI